jgi:tRNA nucleotidyltransferase (CCA-adding enzyme)
MIKYPRKLDIIFKKLNNLNINAVIVGGYVRDSLLGKESKDIDIELYGISTLDKVEEVLKEFGNINQVGKSFGVCKLFFEDLDLDFSLPRLETKISSGHKGFEVSTYSHLNFETASSRRDFTINAIGFDVEKKIILDPHHGVEDLKSSSLHFVNKTTFAEDPLRILRGIQFCSRYNLSMSRGLFELCQEMIHKNMLHELPKERIFDEIKKLLLESQKPSLGLILFKKLGAFSYFSELYSLSEDAWHKTLLALDEMVQHKIKDEKTNIILMLSLLCYFLSEDKKISFLEKLSHERKILSSVLVLTQYRLNKKMSDSEIYRLATKTNLQHTVLIHLAIYPEKQESFTKIQNRAKKLGVLHKKIKALVQGRDLIHLGVPPSKSFSQILASAYEAQMDGVFKTHGEAILWLKKELLA